MLIRGKKADAMSGSGWRAAGLYPRLLLGCIGLG